MKKTVIDTATHEAANKAACAAVDAMRAAREARAKPC